VRFVIADTGPLVTFLVRQAQHHRWACETMATLRPPLLTCEPVLAELHDKPRVWTLDSDFRVYRRLGRLVIPTLTPHQTHR
jgi:hypothetical protein